MTTVSGTGRDSRLQLAARGSSELSRFGEGAFKAETSRYQERLRALLIESDGSVEGRIGAIQAALREFHEGRFLNPEP